MVIEKITKEIITSNSDERNALHRIFGGMVYESDFDTYHPNGGIGRRIQVDTKRFRKPSYSYRNTNRSCKK